MNAMNVNIPINTRKEHFRSESLEVKRHIVEDVVYIRAIPELIFVS
jgi:hypothetical protein